MINQLSQTTFNNNQKNETEYINYCINNKLMNINTLFPARVISVSEDGLRATIAPTISIIASNQNSPLPSTIADVPVGQLIGGISGIEIRLKENDIVQCCAMMRDISNIKKNWGKQAIPASARKFSISDAIIMYVLSNTLPINKIKITDAGIEITAPGLPVTVNGSIVQVNADVVKLGNGASNKVLLEDVDMIVNIAGVQPGSGVTNVTLRVNSGGSSKVEGAI